MRKRSRFSGFSSLLKNLMENVKNYLLNELPIRMQNATKKPDNRFFKEERFLVQKLFKGKIKKKHIS